MTGKKKYLNAEQGERPAASSSTEKEEQSSPSTVTTYVHKMNREDSLLIDDKIEITLQQTKGSTATLRIKSPKSVTLAPRTRKYP